MNAQRLYRPIYTLLLLIGGLVAEAPAQLAQTLAPEPRLEEQRLRLQEQEREQRAKLLQHRLEVRRSERQQRMPPAKRTRPATVQTVASVPEQDSLALVALYRSADGRGWQSNQNWLIGPVSTWENVEVTDGRVTNLGLGLNKLRGPIPPELGQLTGLKGLYLWGNDLRGPIPPELGNLTSLQSLWLFGNELTGPIPPELGQLTNLQVLWLNANQFSGALPPELGQLANLQSINLLRNQLSGPIPPELGQLTKLEELDLSENQLSGTLPAELGQLANLRILNLWNNPLSGSLPMSFIQLSALEAFYFALTDLCVPPDEAFQAWLSGVDAVEGTGEVCTETAAEEPTGIPTSYELLPNYPNPFEHSTTIGYALPRSQHVVLSLYDALGREVRRLVDESQAAGHHTVELEGEGLTGGVYLCRLRAGDYVESRVLVLVR